MIKKLRNAFFIAFTSFVLVGPAGATELEARQVIDFMFDITHADHKMREAVEEGLANADPALAQLLRDVFQSMDMQQLRQQISGPIADQLSVEDIRAFQNFIQSRAGRSLAQLGIAAPDSAQLVTAVQRLPMAEQRAIDTFFSSPAFERMLAAMSSPQMEKALRNWGSQVACDYVEAHPEVPRLNAAMVCLPP